MAASLRDEIFIEALQELLNAGFFCGLRREQSGEGVESASDRLETFLSLEIVLVVSSADGSFCCNYFGFLGERQVRGGVRHVEIPFRAYVVCEFACARVDRLE